jgi:glycosyl transferase family 25
MKLVMGNKSIINEKNVFTFNNLVIYYINLEHREDRNFAIINEFKKLGLNQYTRFNAIMNDNGALGCALSHKAIVEEWKTNSSSLLMVCEDDIEFNCDREEIEELIFHFINDENLDILCLSHNHFNQSVYSDYFNLTSDTQTTACYVVKPHMRNQLYTTFLLSTRLLEQGIDSQFNPQIDMVWKLLQKKFNFVIPKQRIAFQRESFSDIENSFVDYKV